MAANTKNDPGQVLAATTLPNTGVVPSLADLVLAGRYQPKPIEADKLLLTGLLAIEAGLVLHLFAGRLRRKNAKNT